MPTVIISENTTGSYIGNFTGVVDNNMKQQFPDNNYNTGTVMEASRYSAGGYQLSVLAFSGLSNIPADAIINSAILGLNLSGSNGNGDTVSVRRVLRDWVAAQVTWNIFSTGNSWTSGGCLGDATDRIAAVTAAQILGTTTGWYTWEDAQLVTDIQAIINGTNPNYGWHLDNSSVNLNHSKTFHTSNDTNGLRPYLSVTYNEEAPPSGSNLISCPMLLGVG